MLELKQAVDRYLNWVVSYFKKTYPTSAQKYYGLFVNNPNGNFVFDAEPIVTELGISTTQADLDHGRAIAANSGTRRVLFDTRTDELHVWDNGVWTVSTVNRGDVFKVGKVYYSPFTQKVFLFDNTYQVEQIKGTTV